MSIDYSKNDQAEKNILLDHSLQMAEQVKNISEQCTEFTEEYKFKLYIDLIQY